MANHNDNFRRPDDDRFREDMGYYEDRNLRRRQDELSADYDQERDIYSRGSRNESRRTGADEKYDDTNYRDQYNRGGFADNRFTDRSFDRRYDPSADGSPYDGTGRNDRRQMRDYDNYGRGNPYDNGNQYGRETGASNNYSRPSHWGKGPKGYTRSDERILEDVSDRFADDNALDATNIEVAVQNGEVILTGNVQSKHEKRHAEDICELVSGVKNVQNQLRVQQQTATVGTPQQPSNNEYYDIGTGAVSSNALGTTYGSSGAAPVGAFDLQKD